MLKKNKETKNSASMAIYETVQDSSGLTDDSAKLPFKGLFCMLPRNVHTEITERLHEFPKIDTSFKADRGILSTTILQCN